MRRNENIAKLQAGYLFPEVGLGLQMTYYRKDNWQSLTSRFLQIARRRRAHQEQNPDAKVISLGIGDTTEPIPKYIAESMQKAAAGLGTIEGYSGYDPRLVSVEVDLTGRRLGLGLHK